MGAQVMDHHSTFYAAVRAYDRYVSDPKAVPTREQNIAIAEALAEYCRNVGKGDRLEYFETFPKDGHKGSYDIMQTMSDFYTWRMQSDYDPTKTECDQMDAHNGHVSQDDNVWQEYDMAQFPTHDHNMRLQEEKKNRELEKKLCAAQKRLREEEDLHDSTRKRLRESRDEYSELEQTCADMKSKNTDLTRQINMLRTCLADSNWKLSTGETSYVLGKETVLGRDDGCTIVIHGQRISKKHGIISKDHQGRYHIQDNGSTNGIYVNGIKIPQFVNTMLSNGDHV